MRIAVLPLDSRPPNWQFPQRLAAIGGVEALLPPRELLGTLTHAADVPALLEWLKVAVQSCDAAVISWDALLYGGLIQSRRIGETTEPEAIRQVLARIDWSRCRGYLYLTVPRLGLSVESSQRLRQHGLVRDYFIAHARAAAAPEDARAQAALTGLSVELGPEFVAQLWQWRARNQELAKTALRLAAEVGLKVCHVAVEDNAPQGPHLAEVEELRALGLSLLGEYGGAGRAPAYSFYDGADECAGLLLARAVLDLAAGDELPVRMLLHPASPGPENYTGLFETHTLDDGLRFLARFLRLRQDESAQAAWLVAYGLQPQPDVFDADPARVFGNPYLLPAKLPQLSAEARVFVSDLCACNAANPNLALKLGQLAGGALEGLVGYNTNFNTLGTTAAWLSLSMRNPDSRSAQQAGRSFLLERLADDVLYQGSARAKLIEWLKLRGHDPLDFSALDGRELAALKARLQKAWTDWSAGPAAQMLSTLKLSDREVVYSFPWQRMFECEVEAS